MSSLWFQVRQKFADDLSRTRILSAIFLLGTVLGLPDPGVFVNTHDKVLMLVLWFFLLLLTWVLFYADSLIKTVWFLAFVASLMTWWKLQLFIPCVMMVLWAFWYYYRILRLRAKSS